MTSSSSVSTQISSSPIRLASICRSSQLLATPSKFPRLISPTSSATGSASTTPSAKISRAPGMLPSHHQPFELPKSRPNVDARPFNASRYSSVKIFCQQPRRIFSLSIGMWPLASSGSVPSTIALVKKVVVAYLALASKPLLSPTKLGKSLTGFFKIYIFFLSIEPKILIKLFSLSLSQCALFNIFFGFSKFFIIS